jgi:hypothetical protein
MSSTYQKNSILAVKNTTTYGYTPEPKSIHIQMLNVSRIISRLAIIDQF